VVKDDLSRRPAYDAYRTLRSYLSTPAWSTRQRSGGNTIVTLYATAKGKVTVLWNERPIANTYPLQAILGEALLVNKVGQVQTIHPKNGTYSISLPGATASRPSDRSDFYVGGDPAIVIEEDTSVPIARMRELPTITEQALFQVRWSGADEGSGVWSYDVQVRDGQNATWQNWLSWTTQPEGSFEGQDGHTYSFRIRARDRAGNLSSYPNQPQAWTTLRLPPTPTPTATATPAPTSTPTPVPSPTPTSSPTAHPPTATPTSTPVSPTPDGTAPPCDELAVNGGFEESDGWTIDDTPHKARYTDTVARTGRRSLQLGRVGSALNRFSYSTVQQRLNIPVGVKATLSLWYRANDGGGPNDYAYFLIRPEGHPWRILHLVRQDIPGWTRLEMDVSQYGGRSFLLRMGVRNDGPGDGGAVAMYVDDVSLRGCKR
jgi:hypothetical protein